MKLVLVRHGQTEQNKRHIWQGHSEGTLSKEGKKQSKKLAKRLVKENIGVVYCSDMQRTRNTIKPFLKNRSILTYYVAELRERDLGVLEGATTEQVEEYMTSNQVTFDNSNFETGETSDEVRERIYRLYNKVIEEHKEDTVLFVSHGGTIAHILVSLFGYPGDKFRSFVPNNVGITKIEIKKGKPKLIVFNDVSYL